MVAGNDLRRTRKAQALPPASIVVPAEGPARCTAELHSGGGGKVYNVRSGGKGGTEASGWIDGLEKWGERGGNGVVPTHCRETSISPPPPLSSPWVGDGEEKGNDTDWG